MDPDAALERMNDETNDTDDRDFAALDLLVWLAKGGAMPLRTRADLIDACERRLTIAIGG